MQKEIYKDIPISNDLDTSSAPTILLTSDKCFKILFNGIISSNEAPHSLGNVKSYSAQRRR